MDMEREADTLDAQLRAKVLQVLKQQYGMEAMPAEIDAAMPLFLAGMIHGVERSRQLVRETVTGVLPDSSSLDAWPDHIG